MLCFAENDPAAEDVSYGQIMVKEKQSELKMRGKTAFLHLHHGLIL